MSEHDPVVALVHERFTEWAGSEMVVEQLAAQWPSAPVFAPITRSDAVPASLRDRVRPGRLTRLTTSSGGYAHLLPLLPLAMARLPIPPVDVVVTSHHAFGTQVVNATDAPVVAYVHSPARWVWDDTMRHGEMGGRGGQAALGAFSRVFRPIDRRAAHRVHTLVANSSTVAQRIQQWWGRDASVIHPPVDTEFYHRAPDVQREDFFVMAGRLVPYKRPDLAVRAATLAGVPLVVTGDGRGAGECRLLAGPTVTFLGRVTNEEQRSLFRRCRGLVMPGIEDFGIVPVEAQACGAPVLAAGAGGALDSVLTGVTGELVPEPAASRDARGSATAGRDDTAVRLWADHLRGFGAAADYDPVRIREHAETFSRSRFRAQMGAVVGAVLAG